VIAVIADIAVIARNRKTKSSTRRRGDAEKTFETEEREPARRPNFDFSSVPPQQAKTGLAGDPAVAFSEKDHK
jgi:hypothetical protein